MKPVLESAIKLLVSKSTDNTRADDALKFTQAALNLAHTIATLDGAKYMAPPKQGEFPRDDPITLPKEK